MYSTWLNMSSLGALGGGVTLDLCIEYSIDVYMGFC